MIVQLLAGAALGLGVWSFFAMLYPPALRLSDALELLGNNEAAPQPTTVLVADENSRLERFGAWVYRRLPVPLSQSNMALLGLQGRSIGDFFLLKTVFALAGFLLPAMVVGVIGGFSSALGVSLFAGLVGGIAGWFLPTLQLRQQFTQTTQTAAEVVHTYIDLVFLERLANRSAVQALSAAAEISPAPLLVRVQACLTRARLEQRSPWPDLERLSEALGVPQLSDVADIMRLDEQGAAIADTLAQRAKELRTQHLNGAKEQAHAVSERMTLWMSVPVLIFAFAFITPPLLRMAMQ